MSDFALTTQLVGSYSKPEWLTDHSKAARRDERFWRVPDEVLQAAQDDAVTVAIHDQELAGLDVITDGEQRRQSFTAYFFRLGGIDGETIVPIAPLGMVTSTGHSDAGKPGTSAGIITNAPVVREPLHWNGPISVDDFRYLRSQTKRLTKATVIGPATLACRVKDEYYGDISKLMLAAADAINGEILALERAGADLIQIDDPDLHLSFEKVEGAATEALSRAVRGVSARTAVHVCYGYARTVRNKRVDPNYAAVLERIAASDVDEMSIEYEQPGHDADLLTSAGDKGVILGLLNLSPTAPVEQVGHIVARANEAVDVIGAERLRLAPDCGMWFLPRQVAFRKIRALALAAGTLRSDLG